MFRVSLILEALRARPVLMFAVAALAQGTLWTLVPALFYAAPPGDVPLDARRRQGVAARLALRAAARVLARRRRVPPRRHRVGVYLLSQLCVVVAFWAVFALGRRIVGAAHATMAILLMGGISVFTVPTLEFGPAVLAMPLTALTLLFSWRALADNGCLDWIALRRGAGTARAHRLCGADPARARRAVHPRDAARPQPAARRSSRSRCWRSSCWSIAASLLAARHRLRPAAGAEGAAGPDGRREAADGVGQPAAAPAVQPCRAGGAGVRRGRPVCRPPRDRARGRALAGRLLRQGLCLFLRARAGLRRDAARGAARPAPARSAAPSRSWCFPASP